MMMMEELKSGGSRCPGEIYETHIKQNEEFVPLG